MMPLAMLPAMPQRVDELLRRQAQRRADAGGGRDGAQHRGRMEARLVDGLGHDQAEPAHRLDADGDAVERIRAGDAVALGDRQHGRHDDDAGMHRTAFEGVVEILAMRGKAVQQRGTGRVAAVRHGRSPCTSRRRPSR